MKRACVGLLCLCALFLTGCDNYREMNKLNIVAGMAIDRGEEESYKVTLELLNLEATPKEGASAQTIDVEGTTVPMALDKFKDRYSKSFYFGNMEIIILSGDVVREEGIRANLDWFVRQNDIRADVDMMIAYDNTAGEVLEARGGDTAIVAYTLTGLMGSEKSFQAHTRGMSLCNIYDALHTQGKTLVMPAVAHEKEDVKGEMEDIYKLKGLAVFDGDCLKGFLPEEQVIPYLYLTNRLDSQRLAFNIPESDFKATILIVDSDAKPTYIKTEEGITIRFDVKAKGIMRQVPPGIDASTPEMVEILQREASKQLAEELGEFMNITQNQLKADVASMGYLVYLKDAKTWSEVGDKWNDVVQDVKVEIDVDVTIKNTGIVRTT